MTDSAELLELAYAALTAAPDTTAAGAQVYRPGDWPTQPGQYPIIRLRLVVENRRSLGRGGPPEFATVATIRIGAEHSYAAEPDNAGAAKAGAALWRLKRQIEVAVIGSYPLTRLIQHIPAIRAQVDYDSSGSTHLAGLQMDVDLEFYEGPENFAPVVADDTEEIALHDTFFRPAPGFVAEL